ncbi:AIPR family protein [Loktanella sp. M215]|uniref:AIPR family protein n=1 Tax=Loktanella sp. M215 TaxID=2675431 RepID=UPI001F48D9C1|nr:AIPR family protein [Loktanella sp. M215]MCF7698244.1 AIPR protein [Loktanella sp. M215]
MEMEEFHANLMERVRIAVTQRIEDPDLNYPSEDLVFSELVMTDISEAGLTGQPETCHWTGKIGNATLRISGYALSDDQTRIDLFVTHYLGIDTLTDASGAEITAVAKQTLNFAISAARGKLLNRLDPSSEILGLVQVLETDWPKLDQFRIFVLTDGLTKAKRLKPQDVEGRIVQVELIDVERLYRHSSGKPRDEIALNFEQILGMPLPCVHIPAPELDYDYALAAIPGEVIRSLYERYNTMLLEKNVRSFLGGRSKVNKGIAATLAEEPGHFMAFNNGLVIVCDDAQLIQREDGTTGVASMRGLQIVNGGQTSSSIYFATRDNKGIDLSKVSVPAKIIILKNDEAEGREKLIGNISRYANSQNAVKTSDLSANRQIHVELEKLSKATWCPDGTGRWFYERAAGSYQVEILRRGRTPAQKRDMLNEIPSKRKLTKNDVAKYLEAWRGLPYQVALGGEKNFAAFMAALDEDPSIVPRPLNEIWFKEMIAKVLLLKAIEAIIRKKDMKHTFQQGYIYIATYTVSLLAEQLGDRVDLQRIWLQQGISKQLLDVCMECAIEVNAAFRKWGRGRQFSEIAKGADFWEKVRSIHIRTPLRGVPELK